MAIAVSSTSNPAGVATDGSNVSIYATTSTGAAAAARSVAVSITSKVAQTVVRVTATRGTLPDIYMQQKASAVFSTMGAWIYDALIPDGSTSSIKVEWSGAVTSLLNHITVFK